LAPRQPGELVMRVVYLHQYFRTPGMAGGTRSYEYASRLVDRGHEVHVVTSDTDTFRARGRATWRTSVESGAIVHWASVPYENSMTYRNRIRAFGRFAWLAARRAAAIEQDVVFATSTPLTIAIPGAYSAKRRRVPMVLEVRDVWPEVPIALGALRSPVTRRAALMLEDWAYQHSKHVIALSPAMADSIRARFPDVPVTIVPNGCDRDLFADADQVGFSVRPATPWLGNLPLILYAGTLGRVNGVGYLVRMAAAMRDLHPQIRIALVGKGAEEDYVRQLARELGVLNRNLFMLDQVTKSEIVGLVGACDLAISTTIDEPALRANSANKVFDGWAAGRPVAINHEGWLADILRRTGAGLVLPAGDPASAAQLIVDFLADERRVATARAAARRLAETEFDRDLLFRRVERVLLAAVEGGQRLSRNEAEPERTSVA
jgi:glycosyltransferase involved in cell wall biosynthesis